MSSNWSALYAQLVRSVNRHSNIALFPKLLPKDVAGGLFRDPAHLFGWLQAADVDPACKNTVLADLLRCANCEDGKSALAVELLLLALWPGLCVIRRRLRTLCSTFTLDADLLGGLSSGILSADPERVTKVAATLLRNLERDLRRIYMREHAATRSSAQLEAVERTLVSEETARPEAIVSAAHAALGPDGALLTAVYIAGFSQKEAAERLGISHDAARKRCQRALARLGQKNDA